MALDRNKILAVDDHYCEELDVPEWKGKVFVGCITSEEADKLESDIERAKNNGTMPNVRARMASMTLCDANGERMFTPGDIDALGRKSSKAIGRIFEKALELNRMSEDSIEETVGNLEATDEPSSG